MGITTKLDINENRVFTASRIFEEYSDEADIITFAESTKNLCVCIVDVVDSTKITARLSHKDISKYYSTFLNTVGAIIVKFQGKIVKNIGDSILYYFEDDSTESQFVRCMECNLAIIQIHAYLNMKTKSQGLPHLDYRISSDYGTVAIAKTPFMSEDIFGQPVNVCTKINSLARPNSLVIGSDLYEVVKKLECYKFEKRSDFSSGLKNLYPVYSASYDDSKIKIVVAKCIERMLLQMGTSDFEEVVK
ncbi:MAG: adenylate/guanylate cyclase domain-containing protein, partial [Nitrosarchaeum sp.]|nr:adenylate/guanylate cyclase domain-containing protein [Nitrosarchaeum sp.]